MRGFQQVYAELTALGARVAGVSTDTWAANMGFAQANGYEFTLLSDWPRNRTVAAFGVQREGATTAMRATFVFDAEGVIRTVIDDPGDMNAHSAGALKAIRELVNGAGG
jgi:peroxiredoxin